ncbi:MAG: VWA domain-containing protein [Planctomycetes bacterium]|nr:VWA domain-containing protein [Planctomycetota bacterium]
MSFAFAAPEWLVALAAVPLIYAWIRSRDRARMRRRMECFGPRCLGQGEASQASWWAFATLGFVLAAMQPEWGRESLRTERKGSDIVVCLDVSRSMLATDLVPNRLQSAHKSLASLVMSGVDDRFALLAFSGETRRLVPLTDDRASYASLIAIANPSAVRRGGTDLAAALQAAREALDSESDRAQAIVLLTDGEDLEGRALAMIGEWQNPIPIHAVGYGTMTGSKIVVQERGRSNFLIDREGRDVVTALDARNLRELGIRTAGSYRDALDDPELLALRNRLQKDATRLASIDDLGRRGSRFAWPLLLAFLCLVFGGRMRT